ncbi:hypothetical protein BCR41DRAFT_348790 [Lobosporangium transversale]|uniref:Secreted protein n=1 Tax=Lobosporangium transversale TaxID=64571 RepID=A0A1Y2GV37_9FUNG|nr:hypothetical protein BCR41DRAFT_348790 [Lobosporangium transversale]ORZ24960.1 hypothetical protein BCR41DRAFT_348790 [Lobosporangium transversale]|eukprot:XP_021883941.1 hypothetical protein BCR41DRAFT_348790 [Lobosporangium transversale]
MSIVSTICTLASIMGLLCSTEGDSTTEEDSAVPSYYSQCACWLIHKTRLILIALFSKSIFSKIMFLPSRDNKSIDTSSFV